MLKSGKKHFYRRVSTEFRGSYIDKWPFACRQITGAMITISKYDDGSEDASKQDRTITIKGNADQVALAQYLINTR